MESVLKSGAKLAANLDAQLGAQLGEDACKELSAWGAVVLSVKGCSVSILADLGGKIASIRFDGHELLQAPLLPYGKRTQTMAFEASDASGWDECLPSVAACSVQVEGSGEAKIPDHGDLWRVPWRVMAHDQRSVRMRGECFSLPLTLERTVTLTGTGGHVRLGLDYELTNVGTSAVPWAWAAHPLFVTDAGDRIRLPGTIKALRLEGSGRGRLGKADARIEWPMAELAAGGQVDLSRALAEDSGVGDKLFAGPLAADEGWCILERPRAGVRITTHFDTKRLPYLGLWLCAGGWPDSGDAKQVCAALEPTTGAVDSLATPGAWQRQLEPGQQAQWSMEVELERYS